MPCLAQQIPQNVNSIWVKTRLSDADAYQKLVDLLRQQGWTRDYDQFRLTELVTHYKPTTATWELRLVMAVGQGLVSFRGESAVRTGGVGSQHKPVLYRGRDRTVNEVHFESINQVALRLQQAIPGSSVEYRLVRAGSPD